MNRAASHSKPKKEAKSKVTFEKAVEKLVSLGKKQGFVTYEQINEWLPSDVSSAEKIEEVIGMLNKKNIEITSGPIERTPVAEVEEDTKALVLKREKELDEEREA